MALANLKGRVAWIFEEENFDVDLIVDLFDTSSPERASSAATASDDPAGSRGCGVARKLRPGLARGCQGTRRLEKRER